MNRKFLTVSGELLPALLVSATLICAQGPSPTLYTLHKFHGTDGAYPNGVIASNGVLLGTTSDGGSSGFGTVFSLTLPVSWSGGAFPESALYSFTGGIDGALPAAGVISGSHGVLYGTSADGMFDGTVYSLTPPESPRGAWTQTLLYSFTGGADGGLPATGVVIGTHGILYGQTFRGGAFGNGVVFSLTPPSTVGVWTEQVLYNFAAVTGATQPAGGLVIGSSGVLYGATFEYGANAGGAVFSLTPPSTPGGPWTEQSLHIFEGGVDGAGPGAGLVIGNAGVLYGTTVSGGAAGVGTVFSLTPPSNLAGAWTEAILYSFTGLSGTPDGANPESKLAIGANGVLYGTTAYGGLASSFGTVFSLTPPASSGGAWTETVLHSFTGGSDGQLPTAVILGDGGLLYGCSRYGGDGVGNLGHGVVFGLML